MRFTGTHLRTSAIAFLLTLPLLSGCGGSPTAPVDHQPPAVGARLIYEERRQAPDLSFDTTRIREIRVEHEVEWEGYQEVHRLFDDDRPSRYYLLLYFVNVQYLENGDLRYLAQEIDDTIEVFDYPFGGGSFRSEFDADDMSISHVAAYQGEEQVDVDGSTYTARVVGDSMAVNNDGFRGIDVIYKVTSFYVPELGALFRLRFEQWSSDTAGVAKDLTMIDTYTLLRIEE